MESKIDIAGHALYSIGAEPISAEQPCGENVRYDAGFEQLEAELAKQESLNAETVDWKVVADLSSGILKNNSKDLLVGAYLCNALLLSEGYAGLAVGLNILNDMAVNFWDGLFPPAKRMRARATALVWLAEKAGAHISAHPPSAADSAAVLVAAEMLKQLDQALVEKMEDQAPMLNELSAPLKNYQRSAAAEAASAESAPAAAAESAPPTAAVDNDAPAPAAATPPATATPSPAPPPAVAAAPPATPAPPPPAPAPAAAPLDSGTLESEADGKKALRQVQASARDIAAFLIAQKPTDARAYRLARVAAWMTIDSEPPDNDGVTQINPPAAERLKYFQAQQDKGDFTTLIPELEKTLARSPFWLDGHFDVVKALRAAGAGYDAAAQTVIRELGAFLARLPGVVELSFADQTPFAGDQTRLWINAEVLAQGGNDSPAGSGDGAAGEPWTVALAEAMQRVAGGDTDQALALMNDGLANSGQPRDQVYWRCALAELLLQSGKAGAASAILESASQQARARQMADWEPQMLARIYRLLFQSYQKQQKTNKDDKSLEEKAEQAFDQLCWFDPVTALSLKGG